VEESIKNRAQGFVGATAVLLTIACNCAGAQQKQSISISSEGVKSRYVQQLAIDVRGGFGCLDRSSGPLSVELRVVG
jgi:hypothetical protein